MNSVPKTVFKSTPAMKSGKTGCVSSEAPASTRAGWHVDGARAHSGDAPEASNHTPSYKIDLGKKSQIPVSGTPSLPCRYPDYGNKKSADV